MVSYKPKRLQISLSELGSHSLQHPIQLVGTLRTSAVYFTGLINHRDLDPVALGSPFRKWEAPQQNEGLVLDTKGKWTSLKQKLHPCNSFDYDQFAKQLPSTGTFLYFPMLQIFSGIKSKYFGPNKNEKKIVIAKIFVLTHFINISNRKQTEYLTFHIAFNYQQ